MSTILFVTWRGLPGLAADDRFAAARLRERGHDVVPAAWDDPVDWPAADLVVVRSCWDYHLRYDEFRHWLDDLEYAGARLWNPAPLLRWNAHKGYLLELAARGVPVVPTVLLPAGDGLEVAELLDARGWDDAVLKPAVGASAWGARTVHRGQRIDPGEWGNMDMLVQPLVPEVASVGEWSLVFLGGAWSHAVRKRPGPGDFRVQHELGGSIEPAHPPADALDVARAVLDNLAAPWLYARVDGVCTAAGFLVMEVELLEPSLFLDLHATAPARFADAIEALLRG